MKITRFKTKYRVDCTPDQFEALRYLVQQGMMELENFSGGEEWLPWDTIRSCKKFSSLGDAMSVDVDMRERGESK